MFGIDWYGLLKYLVSPGITIAVWFAVDRVIVFAHKKEIISTRFLTRHAGDESERKLIMQRAKTFQGLVLQSLRIIVAVFFIFILLSSFGIDPTALVAGVGVVGLGLSLAAQNILRDFLNGLFIVIEDQYNVGDWVDISSYSGTVESFSLRVTRLRALDGRQIIIPNSSVVQVINYTKNWAMSIVEIGLSYDSNVSEAVRILERCCDELTNLYPGVILDKPNIQAIVDFRPNDMLVRVMTKTIAGEQWGVGRALRRIVKERFDDAGFEIPMSQMVLHDAEKRSASRAERRHAFSKAKEVKEAGGEGAGNA